MFFKTKKRVEVLEKSMVTTMMAVAQLQIAVIQMGGVVDKATHILPLKDKKVTKRKHKKHNFFKACGTCGKAYKGNLGLSIHKKKAHGINGKWLDK